MYCVHGEQGCAPPTCLLSLAGHARPKLCFSLSLPPSCSHAHGVHAMPCQRCGANTEIARAGLDEAQKCPRSARVPRP